MLSIANYQYFEIFGDIVWTIGNLIIPSDRAYRVVFETKIETILRDASGRIAGKVTRIRYQLHLDDVYVTLSRNV
jgi:hypothetical protein